MKKTKKALASLAIAGMALTMVPFNAFAADTVNTRLSGNTAVQTSQAISKDGWLTNSDFAVLAPATAYNMVDALAAAPLAAALKAPVLLSDGDKLSPEAQAEIKRLGVKTVYVTSGLAVIKAGVIADLQGLGVQIVNLGGFDQYETSVNIAKKIATLTPTTSIYIANGETARVAQDALSVASVAGAQSQPILLTQKGQLPKVVADYIASIKANVTASYITGGTGVVSDAVKAQLPGTVSRNAGNDAYDTNLEVLKNFSGLDFGRVFVANGETMIDALAGASLAAQSHSPIVLVNGSVKNATADFLKTKITASSVVTALGGAAVVSDAVRSAIANPGVLVVNTVEGTTTTVFEDKGDQVLGISINGVDKTIADLKAAGYTVQFQATQEVFLGEDDQSTDGVLTRNLMDAAPDGDFYYVVNLIKGDAVVATSASRHVNIKEKVVGSSVIDQVRVYLGDSDYNVNSPAARVTSGKITKDDHALLRVKGTKADDSYGYVADIMNYASSDPSIAYVDKSTSPEDGYMAIKTGGHTGPVTLTLTATDGTKSSIDLTVVDGKRKPSATNTVASYTAITCVNGADGVSQGSLTVKDQYGDPVKGEELQITNPEDGDGALATVMASTFHEGDYGEPYFFYTMGGTVTDEKGRVIITVIPSDSNSGTGTTKIKDADSNTLMSIPTRIQMNSSISQYKFVPVPFASITLDASDATLSHTFVRLIGFDSSMNKAKTMDLSGADGEVSTPDFPVDNAKFTVKINGSTDENDYIGVKWDNNVSSAKRLEIYSKKKVQNTPIEVSIYEAGIKRTSIPIVPGDTRLGITGVTFPTSRPTIGSLSAYDISDFIEEAGIKTADGSPVYFEADETNKVVYIEAVDGTIIGNIKFAVTEGDLEVNLNAADKTVNVTSNTAHEDGKIVMTVNKLNGAPVEDNETFSSERIGEDLDVPGNADYVGSITINVTDIG